MNGTVSLTQSLKDECLRQEENCNYTAVSFTIWLRYLRRVRILTLVLPVILGGIATWQIVAEDSPTIAAVCAFLATIIPPTYKASKYEDQLFQFEPLTGEFTNLRDRFRQAALIASQRPVAEFEAEVKDLTGRLEKARSVSLTPPEWCFKSAQKKIKAGHYKHDAPVETR